MTCHLDHFNSLSQVENFSKKKEKGMNEWIYQWNKPYNKQTPAEDTKHEAAPKLKKNQTCRASIKLRKNFFFSWKTQTKPLCLLRLDIANEYTNISFKQK